MTQKIKMKKMKLYKIRRKDLKTEKKEKTGFQLVLMLNLNL